MTLSIYANANRETPASGLVRSVQDASPLRTLSLVSSDLIAVNLYLVDGDGGYDIETDDETVAPRIAIGIPGQTFLAELDSFTGIASGWTGTLDLDDAAIDSFLIGVKSREATFQVSYTNSTGHVRTVAQQRVTLLKEVQA